MRRAIPAAILTLVLASCGGEHAEATDETSAPAPAPATTSAAPAPKATPSSLGSIAEEGGAVTISYMENGEVRELYGDPKTTGKRKYSVGDGPVLYEVKPGDDAGFKLRNPDGTLRWKVKVAPDKIKISDNEQNDRPCELKIKDANRVKVTGPDGQELGNVRFAGGRVSVDDASGRVIFSVAAQKPSGGYGALLCNAVPERERFILAAELLSRGR